jgi:hypothetical protein
MTDEAKKRILIDYQVSRRECDVEGCNEKRVATDFRNGKPFSVCLDHDNGTFIPELDEVPEVQVQPKYDSIPPGMGD